MSYIRYKIAIDTLIMCPYTRVGTFRWYETSTKRSLSTRTPPPAPGEDVPTPGQAFDGIITGLQKDFLKYFTVFTPTLEIHHG